MTKLTLVRPEQASEDRHVVRTARRAKPAELSAFALTTGAVLVGVAYMLDWAAGRRSTLGGVLQGVAALVVIIGAGIFADPIIARSRDDLAALMRRVRR